MAFFHSTQDASALQPAEVAGYAGLRATLDGFNSTPVLQRLQEYRRTGRPGWPLRALWRAYVASFILNTPHTNGMIRRLQEDPELRSLCGFPDGALPSRRTFNRFIARLSHHPNLVETTLVDLTNRLKELLPDLGDVVAIDSTTIRSHSNPNRKHISDPEASWTAKNSPRAKSGGKEWHWGYKSHAIADVKYGLPLGQIVTTASRGDSPVLPAVVEHTRTLHPWFRPKVVIADRGYDAQSNHEYLYHKGIIPIIHIKKPSTADGLHDGIYTKLGVPLCMGQVPMEYAGSHPEKGRLYRCHSEGCHFKGAFKAGALHCRDSVWEDPLKNLRLFGVIRRDGPEWRAYYRLRQAIERVFKSLKESRRLERHCVRGLRQITLHSLMSSLAFQATALVRLLAGEIGEMRWMVRRVA